MTFNASVSQSATHKTRSLFSQKLTIVSMMRGFLNAEPPGPISSKMSVSSLRCTGDLLVLGLIMTIIISSEAADDANYCYCCVLGTKTD